jgi:hypothetical protein
MERRPCELIVDGDTVLVPGQRGSTARVDLMDEGFCVTVAGQGTVLPANAYGFTRAATRLSAAALCRVRRRGVVSDLFARDVVDVASVSRVKRLLWRMWATRAVRMHPACAPLLYSRRVRQALVVCGTPAFLQTPWLLEDALRFRAARAVLAHLANLTNRTPHVWVPWSLPRQIEAASRWRHVLCHDDVTRVPRALHVTLERFNVAERALPHDALDPGQPRTSLDDFEDDIDLDDARLDTALGALRHIRLVRPVESLRHLLVLSGFGRESTRQPRGALDPRSAFLQRLDVDAIEEGIDAFARALGSASDEPTLPSLLGAYLARDTSVPRGGGLALLARRAVELHLRRRMASPERATQRPPVPLPTRPGIRFLENSAEVFGEGDRMHHCVAGRADAAVTGQAFLFHVEHNGDAATIEVDPRGRVVEARGPANGMNTAVEFGRDFLARWGLGFGLSDFLDEVNGDAVVDARSADDDSVEPRTEVDVIDEASRSIGATGQPPITTDETVVRTLGELCAVLVDIDAPRARVRPFLRTHLPRCQRGGAWLVSRRHVDGTAAIVVIDVDGRVRASLGDASTRMQRGHGRKRDGSCEPGQTALPTPTTTTGGSLNETPIEEGAFDV